MSPRKVRMVANMVRGKTVEDALAILRVPCRARRPRMLTKVLNSAVANADGERATARRRRAVRHHGRRRRRPDRRSAGCRARWAAPTASTAARQPRHRRGRRDRVEERDHGTENTSDRFPPRHHQDAGRSKWYEEKNYAKWLHEDLQAQGFVKEKLDHAGVALVEVERAANKAKINIYTARPGIVIGKRGAGVETLKKDVQALTDERGLPQHPGGPQGRDQRAARRREHRDPARAPHRLPPRHEEGGADRDEVRRQGHPRRLARAASAAPRWRATSGTARAACRCTRCAPTSSTASPRRTPPTAPSA